MKFNKIKNFLLLFLVIISVSFSSCTKYENKCDTLSEKDLEAIAELREAIKLAVLNGDAVAYADLCIDDVQLLHPGSPIVAGRDNLIEHNSPMFEAVKVKSLILTPVKIYGEGDLAYEVGTQSATIEPALEGFSSSRKYLHVMQREENGEWRFVALMSSDSE